MPVYKIPHSLFFSGFNFLLSEGDFSNVKSVVNALSLCIRNCLYFILTIKKYFSGYIILDWQLFFSLHKDIILLSYDMFFTDTKYTVILTALLF